MEINALIQKVQQGDVDCYEPIIRKYEQPIYRFCLFLLGNRQEAEDAAQDIFFKSYEHLDKFDPAQPFSAWLYKIAENHCRNLLKRRRRLFHLLPLFHPTGQARSAEQVYSENMETELAYWFHGLSVREKKLLFLRVVQDYSYEEIAHIMEESAPTVRKRFERLKAKLRKKSRQGRRLQVMNNDSNYDKLVRSLKKAQVEEIDVAPKVMQRIRGYEQAGKKPIRSLFRLRSSVVAMMLFFLTAVSVSGAATFLFEWNGIEIKTFKYEPEPGNTWHDHMTFLQIIDYELQKKPAEWKEVSLEETQKEWPVPLMRPVHTDKKPVRTFGVVVNPGKQWEKEDVYIGGFYDVFEQGADQIVVRQTTSTSGLGEGKIAHHFPAQWEVVKVDERILSVFWEYNNRATLDLRIKSDDTTTIHLSFEGNVSKKELVKLAEAYLGQKLKL